MTRSPQFTGRGYRPIPSAFPMEGNPRLHPGMAAVTLRNGVKDDGSEYSNFRTLDVLFDGKMIGAVQCMGVCYGETAYPGHKHGPWVAFVGNAARTARNLAGLYNEFDDAVRAVIEAQ